MVAICVIVVLLGRAFYAQQQREEARPAFPGADGFGVDPGPPANPDNPYSPPRTRV